MKVIIIRDALVNTVINTYMVNDDVTLPTDTEDKLKEMGYTHQVLHPIPMNQAGLMDEIQDYLNPDKDMGKCLTTKPRKK